MTINPASRAKTQELREIAGAWKTLHDQVGLGQIRSDRQYKNMVAVADKLVDEIAGNERYPLSNLLEIVATQLEQYESESTRIEDAEPRTVLSHLMEQYELKQTDLRGEIGSQGVVSEIPNGKRETSARQAKALAERFGVSAAVFFVGGRVSSVP